MGGRGAILLPLLTLPLLPLIVFSFSLHQLVLLLQGSLPILLIHIVALTADVIECLGACACV